MKMAGVLLFMAAVIVLVTVFCKPKDRGFTYPSREAFRCPVCGAQVRIRGDKWECTFCGDSGRLAKK